MSKIIIEYQMPDNVKEKHTLEIPEHAVGIKINGYTLKTDAEGLEIGAPDGNSIRLEPIASNLVYITNSGA